MYYLWSLRIHIVSITGKKKLIKWTKVTPMKHFIWFTAKTNLMLMHTATVNTFIFVGTIFRGFYKMHWSPGSWIGGFKHYKQKSMRKLYFVKFNFRNFIQPRNHANLNPTINNEFKVVVTKRENKRRRILFSCLTVQLNVLIIWCLYADFKHLGDQNHREKSCYVVSEFIALSLLVGIC